MPELSALDNAASSWFVAGRIIRAPSSKLEYADAMTEPDDLGNIGAQLQALLEERKLSRHDLAEMSGLSYSYLSNLIRGHKTATLDTIAKLSRALGLAPVVFLGNDSLIDLPLIGTIDHEGLVTMDERLPGLLAAADGLASLGIPSGATLHCSPCSSLSEAGIYLVRKKDTVKAAAWNGTVLTMGDGERVLFSAELHTIVGRVVEVRWRPILPG